jgi:hypothetical protein
MVRQRVIVFDNTFSTMKIKDPANPESPECSPKEMSIKALKSFIANLTTHFDMLHMQEQEKLADLNKLLSSKIEVQKRNIARQQVVVSAAQQAARKLDNRVNLAILALQDMVEEGEVSATDASAAINLSRAGLLSELSRLTGLKL